MSKIGSDVLGKKIKLKIDKCGWIYLPKSLREQLSLKPGTEIDVEEFAQILGRLKYSQISKELIKVPVKYGLWGPVVPFGFLQENPEYLAKVTGFSKTYGLQRIFVQKKRGEGYLYDDIAVNDILEEATAMTRREGRKRKFALVEDKKEDMLILRPLTLEDVVSILRAKEAII